MYNVVRWKNGVRTETKAEPTPYDAQRAEEIFQESRRSPCWASIDDFMTDEEVAFTLSVWKEMPGNTCFWDAFNRIRRGDIPG